MSKKNRIILGIVILLVVAAGSFYGGTIYSKNQSASTSSTLKATFAGRGARGGAGAGGGLITGTILSNNGNSIALQLPSGTGGSKIIIYSDATQIAKMVAGTSADLTTGTSVVITGTTNSDGSITADSIQIRPAGQNFNPGQQAPAQ